MRWKEKDLSTKLDWSLRWHEPCEYVVILVVSVFGYFWNIWFPFRIFDSFFFHFRIIGQPNSNNASNQFGLSVRQIEISEEEFRIWRYCFFFSAKRFQDKLKFSVDTGFNPGILSHNLPFQYIPSKYSWDVIDRRNEHNFLFEYQPKLQNFSYSSEPVIVSSAASRKAILVWESRFRKSPSIEYSAG